LAGRFGWDLWNQQFGLELGFAAVLAMPLDRTSRTSSIFSAGGSEDVLLVAIDLLLDAYMQWFHIGSYRLAGYFSQRAEEYRA
jgi:hypothetical protein